MRILHVYNNFHPFKGGIESYIEDLCSELIKSGHTSDVCCLDRLPKTKEKLPKREAYKGITIHRIPFMDTKYYKIAPSVLKIAKRYDIVHVYGTGFFSDFLCLTKILHRKPVFVSGVGGVFHTKDISGIKKVYFNLWCRFALHNAEKIIAISDHDRKLFSKISLKVEVIPVPIATEKFMSKERKKSNFKMVYVGRISKNKRIDRLIDVVKILARQEPRTKLYIIGKDWEGLRASLEKRVLSEGIWKNVEFVGEASNAEMLRHMHEATFFLSASEYESFGISAVEAMASGLIVVLNDLDSFRYFVRNGENGYVVDYSKPEEVAALIFRLSKTPLSGISKKAMERVKEFRKSDVSKKIEALYVNGMKN